ncbi:NAD(P)-dependent oxidoreductase [Aurantimonas sp. A2-1-M11]
MREIAFIGLGSMGLPMAINLAKAGYAVRGHDMRQAAMDALVDHGGSACDGIGAACSGVDALFLMVVNADQAAEILFEGGALEALAPGGTVCLMSTCPPGAVETLAERVGVTGHAFVDCPVSGGVAGAQSATLTMMAACSAELFAALRPALTVMGSKLYHVGEKPGQGAVVKSINQLLCGVHLAAAAEAMALGGKVGLDRNVLLEIVGGSAASSWMLRDRGPRLLEADPNITSTVDIFVKDLGIVMEAGRDAKAAVPLAALAHQLFLAASGAGDGAADDSQVIRSYQRLNAMA